MNKIYKAIEHFEHLQKRYTTTHNGKHCELVKTALAALREQAERENGCEWCQEPPSEWKLGDKIVGFTTQYYEYGDDASHYVRNKFCPMCGKRLEEHHEAD
jgi:hypothetical protein